MMLATSLQPKQCAICPKQFMPRSSFASVCSQRCAMKLLKAKAIKERQEVQARRTALETIPELIRAADKDFAAYIRRRDQLAGHTCISSGEPLDWSGNQVDAGHYRSRGAASHLRYDERNCHAQTKYDNRHRAGNVVEYRIRLIARISLEDVAELEASNEPHKWTRDELREIRATYKAKTKALERATQLTETPALRGVR